jgi:hypothetical protein
VGATAGRVGVEDVVVPQGIGKLQPTDARRVGA